MNSSRFPSGSRTYTLDAAFRLPPWRTPGPSMILAVARSSIAFSAAGVPSQTKHRSPHGGLAAGARNFESLVLPVGGTMEIDHLIADIHRAGGGTLRHVKSQPAIEGHHRFSILHGEGNVIEAPNAPRLLRLRSSSARREACGHDVSDKPAPACHHNMITAHESALVRARPALHPRNLPRVTPRQATCMAWATASLFPEVQASTSDFPLAVRVTQYRISGPFCIATPKLARPAEMIREN